MFVVVCFVLCLSCILGCSYCACFILWFMCCGCFVCAVLRCLILCVSSCVLNAMLIVLWSVYCMLVYWFFGVVCVCVVFCSVVFVLYCGFNRVCVCVVLCVLCFVAMFKKQHIF